MRAPELTIFFAWTGRKGATVFYGVVEEPNGKRTASKHFRRPASAVSHARTIAANINGDASGGGIYAGACNVREVYHPHWSEVAGRYKG